MAYYSRRLAQVVYTLLVQIDSTKENRGQLYNCSHNNETVGSYQPFHDQVGHGLCESWPVHLVSGTIGLFLASALCGRYHLPTYSWPVHLVGATIFQQGFDVKTLPRNYKRTMYYHF